MAQNIQVTQFPDGLGTVRDNNLLASLPVPVPGVASFFDDLDAGSNIDAIATQTALAAGVTQSQLAGFASGVRRFSTAGADGDGNAIGFDQATNFADNMVVNVAETWLGIRFRVDDPVEFTLLAGFFEDGAALAPADGIFLRCADGSGVLEIVAVAAAGGTTAANLGTLSADTWYEAHLYCDLTNVSGQFIGPGGIVGGGNTIVPGANLTAVQVQPNVNFAAGEAAVKNFDLDYVLFAGGR